MHDEFHHALDVEHTPICPPRPCTPGEGIYLSLWQEWTAANPREWLAIFNTNDRIGQRAASVAASYMVFMGCNGGRGFTHEALRTAEKDHYRERAFLAAWAQENRRSKGINHGLRTIEYVLAAEHPIKRNGIGDYIDWEVVPAVTMHDTDIVESMVAWWAGHSAGVMREIAEPMIEAANRKRLSGIFGGTSDRKD